MCDVPPVPLRRPPLAHRRSPVVGPTGRPGLREFHRLVSKTIKLRRARLTRWRNFRPRVTALGRPLFRGGRPRHSGAGDKLLDTVQHHESTPEHAEPMGWVLSVEGAKASLRLNVTPRGGAA